MKGGLANLTTVGFLTENRIGVHLYETSSGDRVWFNKLLIFDIASQKTLANRNDFPCAVLWVNGNIVCLESRHADIYDQNLNLLAHYLPSLDPKRDSMLEFVARNGMVHISPDQLWMSVPVNGSSEVLSTHTFKPVYAVPGTIKVLGNDHWVVQRTPEFHFTEQSVTGSELEDVRPWPEIPNYLGSNMLFVMTNKLRMHIEDEEGHLLHDLGKTSVGSDCVVPDHIGRRFAYEVFIEKAWDWSGTAQYKKLRLRVFETATGKEIFHMDEVPSEDEPTFEHYLALSPSGMRLAVIRNGILKIYELPR